jgi:hypothetical protein
MPTKRGALGNNCGDSVPKGRYTSGDRNDVARGSRCVLEYRLHMTWGARAESRKNLRGPTVGRWRPVCVRKGPKANRNVALFLTCYPSHRNANPTWSGGYQNEIEMTPIKQCDKREINSLAGNDIFNGGLHKQGETNRLRRCKGAMIECTTFRHIGLKHAVYTDLIFWIKLSPRFRCCAPI